MKRHRKRSSGQDGVNPLPYERVVREGHSIFRYGESGTAFILECRCGWFSSWPIALKEEAEREAYMHVTRLPSHIQAILDGKKDQ